MTTIRDLLNDFAADVVKLQQDVAEQRLTPQDRQDEIDDLVEAMLLTIKERILG